MQRASPTGRAASSTELEVLKQGRWFGGLDSALQELIVSRSVVRSYARGEFIVREGEPGRSMFAVLHGRTRHVRSIGGDGDEVLLHVGEPGLWVGEYAMLSGAPSIVSVIADTDVQMLLLSAQGFQRIVDAEPRYYRAFVELLCERFALVFRYMAEARSLSPEEWLRTRLNGVVELQGLEKDPTDPATITLSQSELANMVGLSRQTLSAVLASLKARGLIEVGYKKIRVLP